MIGKDDRVVNRWTLRVTHTGEFRGIPATKKRITITGIGIFRFSEEGKVIESCDSLDQLGMLKQLDVVKHAAACVRLMILVGAISMVRNA